VRGVLHCFSGGPGLLDAALAAGWYISFAGMVTFRNFDGADLLRAVPADRLLLETDSPYLAPVPHRGRRNEPAFVVETCRAVAAPARRGPGRTRPRPSRRPTPGASTAWPRRAVTFGLSTVILPALPYPRRPRELSMPRRIEILPDTLANQIAAGEVVERPASVVKELVENALDAGATRIDIAVRNGGKTEIRVADDGHGMGRDDALLCLDRHATSKISRPEDLLQVRSFGFRGEALPSIASVSRLTLETAESGGVGTRVGWRRAGSRAWRSARGRRARRSAVRNLFMNVPARAKFLRSAAVETRAVVDAW
jgi:hypothetical protein